VFFLKKNFLEKIFFFFFGGGGGGLIPSIPPRNFKSVKSDYMPVSTTAIKLKSTLQENIFSEAVVPKIIPNILRKMEI